MTKYRTARPTKPESQARLLSGWVRQTDEFSKARFMHTGVCAGPDKVGGRQENAATVCVGFHYNGSGEKFFGGVGHWPHVDLGISFPAGHQALADEFAEKAMRLVHDFYNQHPEIL